MKSEFIVLWFHPSFGEWREYQTKFDSLPEAIRKVCEIELNGFQAKVKDF